MKGIRELIGNTDRINQNKTRVLIGIVVIGKIKVIIMHKNNKIRRGAPPCIWIFLDNSIFLWNFDATDIISIKWFLLITK